MIEALMDEIDILNKFRIGEEFALHEFELEYKETKSDMGIDYNIYSYRTDLISKEVLGYRVKEVVLAYNCDILKGVFCIVQENTKN